MGISYLGYKRRLCSSSFDQVGDHLSPTVVRGGGGLPPPPAPPRMRGAFGAQQCAVGARAPNGAQGRLRRGLIIPFHSMGAFGAGMHGIHHHGILAKMVDLNPSVWLN